MRYTYLLKVEPGANNNKEYVMQQTADDRFEVSFGRVGATHQKASYNMWAWDKKLREKLAKGYKDLTHLKVDGDKSNLEISHEQEQVKNFLHTLVSKSRTAFSKTYNVSASVITPAMVFEAQRLINDIKASADLDVTKSKFLELWHVIPRKIDNVRDALPKDLQSVIKMLEFEQESLDNANAQKKFAGDLLENLGLQIQLVDADDEVVETMLKGRTYRNVYRIKKAAIDKRFNDWLITQPDKTCEHLFHGTKWQNGIAILDTGLRILGRKAATYSGSMLGDAIYSSMAFEKSYNYSDGIMLINQVHVGRKLITDNVRHYNEEMLRKMGYDCVSVNAGTYTGRMVLRNHELTVYNEAQVNFSYLIEL